MKTPKAKTKAVTPKVATTVKELLAQIYQVAKGGSYIFRGENKNYGRISSKLYRYFRVIIGRAELQQKIPALNLNPIKKELKNKLDKKSAQKIDFTIIEKILKENILDQLAQKNKSRVLEVGKIQKELIFRDVQEYVDFENEIDTLAELQHYGGSTNLIDFSHDLAVALFFACDGEPEKNGRLILLKAEAKGVISPKKNQNNRTVFQKSIFVQRDKGYIEKKDIKQFFVSKKLKKLILPYVQNYFGIRTETVYGDLMGYIQNQERHREAYEKFFAGSMHYSDKEFGKAVDYYKKAIKLKPNFAEAHNNSGLAKMNLIPQNLKGAIIDYNKAIKLNPNFFNAHNNRGIAKMRLSPPDLKGSITDYNKAIELYPNYANVYSNRGLAKMRLSPPDLKGSIIDYNKAIELDSNFVHAYNNRGIAYRKKDEHDRAIVDFDKVIELNPNDVEAHANRGLSKKALLDIKGAKKDFQKALRLAKQQGKKGIADRIQKEIDKLLYDSDK